MSHPRADEQEPVANAIKEGATLRCHCGSLLARLVPQGVEIKCRRCKRRVVIPLTPSRVGQQKSPASEELPGAD